MCFYTDGVVEARAGGELFGAERLAEALGELGETAARSAARPRGRRRSTRPDDMAACLLDIGARAGARPRSQRGTRARRTRGSAPAHAALPGRGGPRRQRDADEIVDSARAIADRARQRAARAAARPGPAAGRLSPTTTSRRSTGARDGTHPGGGAMTAQPARPRRRHGPRHGLHRDARSRARPKREAERWLRILRLHGQAGAALQALGVSEAPLEAHAEGEPRGAEPAARRGRGRDRVPRRRLRSAASRGAQCFGTVDVLLAVMDVYGEDFDSRPARARHRPRRGARALELQAA